jgi:NAD(P)-dependent dehydrogenase (short-subunit alcohol dehydrogenase family)
MKPPISVDLSGKTALVTGATGGIGKEIARGLAKLGATVVIGARNPERGEAARAELAGDTGNSNLSVMALDVADMKSVRAFAAAFGERPLHILVNNAGAWFTDRRQSPDGHELTLATDVLGPHLLTSLLLPRLRASGPARIVNIVSSLAGNYDAEDLQFQKRKFDGFKAYAQAKQALRMLTWGQAARLAGSQVTANTAAPGFVRTDFNQNARGFIPSMINFSLRLIGVTPAEGADTPLWVSAAPELEGASGKYFDARKEKDGKYRDPAAIADLERRCDELVGERGNVRAA